MNKFFAISAISLALCFTSCSDDDSPSEESTCQVCELAAVEGIESRSETVCEGEDGRYTVNGGEFGGPPLRLEEVTAALERSGVEADEIADQAALLVVASEADVIFEEYIAELVAAGATCVTVIAE